MVIKNKLVLGIDTSGEYCSVGLAKGDAILGEVSEKTPQAHSDKLIPFIDKLLKENNLKIQDVKGIAVSIGPGCFTGLRVGVATAKALAQGLEIPIVGVPTLDMIALNAITKNGDSPIFSKIRDRHSDVHRRASPYFQGQSLICVIVDARKQQVYTAIYSSKFKKLTKDLVLTIEGLLSMFSSRRTPRKIGKLPIINAGVYETIFIGNAISVYGEVIKERMGERAIFTPKEFWYPHPSNIALAGLEKLQKNKKGDNLFKLKPIYLREPDIRKKTNIGTVTILQKIGTDTILRLRP